MEVQKKPKQVWAAKHMSIKLNDSSLGSVLQVNRPGVGARILWDAGRKEKIGRPTAGTLLEKCP